MKIKIDKKTYDELSDDDKTRYIYLTADAKFENLVKITRKKLSIPKDGLVKIYKEERIHIPQDKREYIKWSTQRKRAKTNRNKVRKAIGQLLKEYRLLDSRWYLFVERLVLYNQASFFPGNYAIDEKEGRVQITIDNLTTRNDFIEWLKEHWKEISVINQTLVTRPPTDRKKKINLPKYENLQEATRIIRLKDQKGLTFMQITKKLYKDDWEDTKKIENIYYRVKNQIDKLHKEQDELKKLQI